MEEQLRDLFVEALQLFFRRERSNIASGISERNLCARLAMTIEIVRSRYGLGHYYADVEYNRKQNGRAKTIAGPNPKGIKITADLILHSRGEIEPDNLIAIEMKIAGRRPDVALRDRERLQAMTLPLDQGVWLIGQRYPEHVVGYVLGYFLEINYRRLTYVLEEYGQGQLVREDQGAF